MAVIASSVLIARARTVSMLSNSSARSALAADIRASESAFVADCVVTSAAISTSSASRCASRDSAIGETAARVAGCAKSAFRWSSGS
jgi:hypothetical protein